MIRYLFLTLLFFTHVQAEPLKNPEPIEFRLLMIIKPEMDLPDGRKGKISPSNIRRTKEAFEKTMPKIVGELTKGRVLLKNRIEISQHVLKKVGYDGQIVGSDDVPEDCEAFLGEGWYDGVIVYWPSDKHAYWTCGSEQIHGLRWSSVNVREDLDYHEDAVSGWIHEWLHQLEGHYFGELQIDGKLDLHGSDVFNYQVDEDKLPVWLAWYADYLNGQCRKRDDEGNTAEKDAKKVELFGLGERAWKEGNLRKGVRMKGTPPWLLEEKAQEKLPAAPVTREWKEAEGNRSLSASFISHDRTSTEVKLRRTGDGKILTLPITRLSTTDQDWIKQAEEAP
jgi:hypothetical protein